LIGSAAEAAPGVSNPIVTASVSTLRKARQSPAIDFTRLAPRIAVFIFIVPVLYQQPQCIAYHASMPSCHRTA